ncbi:MAG: hypothetical protein Q8O92_16145 [Candidatus Latescibacter sp.]|nr:hypothetical protein [Candidatus Latescibacter sp.]
MPSPTGRGAMNWCIAGIQGLRSRRIALQTVRAECGLLPHGGGVLPVRELQGGRLRRGGPGHRLCHGGASNLDRLRRQVGSYRRQNYSPGDCGNLEGAAIRCIVATERIPTPVRPGVIVYTTAKKFTPDTLKGEVRPHLLTVHAIPPPVIGNSSVIVA